MRSSTSEQHRRACRLHRGGAHPADEARRRASQECCPHRIAGGLGFRVKGLGWVLEVVVSSVFGGSWRRHGGYSWRRQQRHTQRAEQVGPPSAGATSSAAAAVATAKSFIPFACHMVRSSRGFFEKKCVAGQPFLRSPRSPSLRCGHLGLARARENA